MVIKITESILSWMRQNESRYKNFNRPSRNSNAKKRNASLLHLSAPNTKADNPQKTIDSYVDKEESAIFDENFSKADFDLLTKQWKEKYFGEISAN